MIHFGNHSIPKGNLYSETLLVWFAECCRKIKSYLKLLQVVVGSAPARLEFHRTLGSRNRMIPQHIPIPRYLGLIILYNLILLEYRFFPYFIHFTYSRNNKAGEEDDCRTQVMILNQKSKDYEPQQFCSLHTQTHLTKSYVSSYPTTARFFLILLQPGFI